MTFRDAHCAVLQIGRSQRRIRIDRAAEQRLQRAIRFDTQIEPGQDSLRHAIFGAVEGRADREGIGLPLRDARPEIAEIARADQRQEDVRPRPQTVMAKRRAEAVVVMRQVELARLGDVEHAADPDRRIDEEAPDGLDRALGLQLQHVVGEHQRLADIREDMPDPGAQRLGDHRLVQHRQRPERDPVEELVDREHRPVEALERIALGPVMPRPRRARGDGRRCWRRHARRHR